MSARYEAEQVGGQVSSRVRKPWRELVHADAERRRRSVERDLGQADRAKPAPDLWSSVGIGGTARPDHVSARGEQIGHDLDHFLHAPVLDIAEDPGQQQHVDRQNVVGRSRITGISATDFHCLEAGRGRRVRGPP